VSPNTRGKLISLATETERTLFFDFLPVDLGEIRGFRTRFHLYTVPGQVYYNASRKLILKGVDGVVFVADSQVDRAEANMESMQNLYDNMAEHGYDLTRMPFVLQYNKRDLPNAAPLGELDAMLNPGWEVTDPARQKPADNPFRPGVALVEKLPTGEWWERVPAFEAVATTGPGSSTRSRRSPSSSCGRWADPGRASAAGRRPPAPGRASVIFPPSPRRRPPVNLPNAITVARIAAAPLIAALPFMTGAGARLAAFVLFIVAAVTDYWDGHLARTRNLVTDLGRLLDPLADKLLLVATLVPMIALMGGPAAAAAAQLRLHAAGLRLRDAARLRLAAVVDRRRGGRPRAVHDDLPAARRAPRPRDRGHRSGEVEDGLPVDLGGRGLLLVLRGDPRAARGWEGREAWRAFAYFNGVVGAVSMVGRGRADALLARALPASLRRRAAHARALVGPALSRARGAATGTARAPDTAVRPRAARLPCCHAHRDPHDRRRAAARLHHRHQRRAPRARARGRRDRGRAAGSVGDDADGIAAAVREALDRTGAVITTGGLGPTATT
jgi:hypothetical protein